MLLRSRFLSVKRDESKYYTTVLTTGRCITSNGDLIELINFFNEPRDPLQVSTGFEQYDLLPAIERLKELGILVAGDAAEEQDVLAQWCNRIADLIPLPPPGRDSPFVIYGRTEQRELAACFADSTVTMKKEVESRLFPFKRSIYAVLLTRSDYENIAVEYCIPPGTIAFVDTKSVLVLNADRLSGWIDKARLYGPSVKHELVHLLLGQYHFYIPVWIEEGICELYSGQKNPSLAKKLLKKSRKMFTFTEAESLIINSIRDLDPSPVTNNIVYAQAYSFVKYLIDTTGENMFWQIIRNTGVYLNFDEIFLKTAGRDIKELETGWENHIRQECV